MRTATASAATVAAIAAIFASTQAAIKPLIMGGTVVPIGEATFVTGIRNATTAQTFCGGSLIHPKWVLTAAHCAGRTDFVNVGTHYNSGATDGNIVKVVNNITHPGYYMLSAGFDFLLLELEKEVTSVTPVALAKADGSDEAGGQFATVYGWGTTEWLGTNSKELVSVDVEIHDQSECKKVFNVTDTMLCAGGERNKDACNGDSGGPLVVTRDGTPTLVGVVSWGTGCGWEGYPGVYARVSKVRDFIDHYVPAVRWL